MWHEARKQERKIRGMLVDYRKRAERRRDFYEKIKADPTQFLQIHGRQGKIHLDPVIAAAAEGAATMMPWQGQSDNLIDRFDVRAHLDMIPVVNPDVEEEQSYEERQSNYERYRIIAQNAFLGINEEKFLKQLHLEEQFGYTEHEPKKKKPTGGAAIGFNYEDGSSATGTAPATATSPTRDENNSEDNSDSDLDVDLAINISKIDSTQAHEMNRHGRNFGMSSNDFYSFLTNDLEEAESFKQAKEEEHEKALFSGRKSRRERRAHREKRLANRKISPPSYAAKESPTLKLDLHDKSESRSPSPENSGKITFITSFGDDEEPQPVAKPTYADKVKSWPKLKKSRTENAERKVFIEAASNNPPMAKMEVDCKMKPLASPRSSRRSTSRLRNRSRRSYSRSSRSSSRSTSRSRLRRRRRNNSSSSSLSSSDSSLDRRRKRRKTSRNSTLRRGSHRRSRRTSSSSSSRSRSKSSSVVRSRSRSKSLSRSSSSSPAKSKSTSSRSPSKSRSRSKSYSPIPELPPSTQSKGDSVKNENSNEPHDTTAEKAVVPALINASTSNNVLEERPVPHEIPPVPEEAPVARTLPRYYGRKKSDHSSSSDLDDSSGEDNIESPKNNQNNNSNIAKIGNSGSATKAGSKTSATVSLAERLKRKRQALLNKQFKADKIAEQMKSDREKQEQQTRDEELRELAIKLRRKQRERRHAYESDSSSSSSSQSKSASPKSRAVRSRSPSVHNSRRSREADYQHRWDRKDGEYSGRRRYRDDRDCRSAGRENARVIRSRDRDRERDRDYERSRDRDREREGFRERDGYRERYGNRDRDRTGYRDYDDSHRERDDSCERDWDRGRDREREWDRDRYEKRISRYSDNHKNHPDNDGRDERERRQDRGRFGKSLVDY